MMIDEESYNMRNLRIRNTRPFTKQKDASTTVVGRVKANGGRCKNHPKHQQTPGVCSLCLMEKLAKLPAFSANRRRITTSLLCSSDSSSSLSSYYDSLCSTSSCSSPVHCFPASGSSSGPIFPVIFKHGIMRRKSMAADARKRDHEDEGGVHGGGGEMNSSRRNGLWFKLLHPKRKIGKA
ncbi:hypothetical protein PIB30_102059 [Stylosanthes scabra]|uniref:Uncharacterized protein n=1 Tax=Stylosanthes scabra TaxID=79078 RepID=A0ABU6XWK5_9FABA|nr:hypothetical protein [Stylosanthes scabra]